MTRLHDLTARARQSRSTAGDAYLRRVLTRDRLARAARLSAARLADRIGPDPCEDCDDEAAA